MGGLVGSDEDLTIGVSSRFDYLAGISSTCLTAIRFSPFVSPIVIKETQNRFRFPAL